jgi:hypothetical protein
VRHFISFNFYLYLFIYFVLGNPILGKLVGSVVVPEIDSFGTASATVPLFGAPGDKSTLVVVVDPGIYGLLIFNY